MKTLTTVLRPKRHIKKGLIRVTPSLKLNSNLGSASALGLTLELPVKIATMGISLKRGKVAQTTRCTLNVLETRLYKNSNAAIMELC